MKTPKHLKHKPIIAVENYSKIDAQFNKKTDVQSLSIGKAQYDNTQISVKVWRHTGKTWSRQNEELPIHRNIDLNILLVAALLNNPQSNYSSSNLREEIVDISEINTIHAFYRNNEHYLKPRLEELSRLLKKYLKS